MISSNVSYGIITTDENLIVKTWNEWLENVSGMTLAQVVGKKITDVIPDMESRGLTARFLKALNESTVEVMSSVFHKYLIRCEINIPGQDTVIMKQHVTIGPLNSGNGVIGLIITIEDASEFNYFKISNEQDNENISHLGDSDWRVRKGAQIKLSKNANHATLASLFKILKDEHKNVAILNSILLVLSQSEADVVGSLLSLLEEDDTDLKIYVIQALGDRNDPRAIPTLIQCLNDSNVNIKYHAIEALGKLEAREAFEHLCQIALSGDFFVSFPAIEALSNLGESSVVSRIISLIDNPIFCDAIIAIIGKLGDADIVKYLTNKISLSEELVFPVCKALLEINQRYELLYREGDLIKDIFNNNIDSVGIHHIIKSAEISNVDEIQYIIKILGWIPSQEAQKSLTRMLGNPLLQKEVIEAFVNYGNKVTDLLIDQLNATDGETRIAAAIALGRIGDPKSGAPLIRMIGKNEDLTVFVIGSLAKLGIREAFEPLLEQLGSQNPSVRRAAIAALNSIGHPEMPVRIEKLIQSNDSLFRESAIHIAGYFGYPNCKKLVHDCLEDADIRVVCAAIENLPFFEDISTNAILKSLYEKGSTRIRTSVVKSATHIDNVSQFKTLEESLNDSDAWVRYYSIRTICSNLLRGHLPKLIFLAQNDKAIHVRLAAIEAIGQLNGTEAIAVFSKLLRDENSDIVLTTIYALGMLESENALMLLMPLYDDWDIQKRCAVIKAISHFNVFEVIEKLYWICATESNEILTNTAIEGLSSIKSVQAVDYLLKLSAVQKIKEKCIAALLLQKTIALQHLFETFDNRSLQLKRNIIEVLSRIKKPEASEALIQFLDHENAQIRIDAMHALYRLGNVNVLEKIKTISFNDPDILVRFSAKEILKKS